MKKIKLPKFNVETLKEFAKRFKDPNEGRLQDLLAHRKDNPHDTRILHQIAELYYRQGKTDEAVATYFELANFYQAQDFVLKAIEAYKSVLKIRPKLVEVNLKLSALYLKVDMQTEAANQFRIAISHYAKEADTEKMRALAEHLVRIDPSNENRAKLAEIYQSCGMIDEAVKQYEFLAKDARVRKNYDKLMHFYELILPRRPNNVAILKDLCILYLRKKLPERVLHIMEQYKVTDDPLFADLNQKTRLMFEALKRQKK